MKPFKLFFILSIGVILFFFLAKVIFFALLLAAGMSIVFFIVRKIRSIFTYGMEPRNAYYQPQYRRQHGIWEQHSRQEPLFDTWNQSPFEYKF